MPTYENTPMTENQYPHTEAPQHTAGDNPGEFAPGELVKDEPDPIRHLKEAIKAGKEWRIALLEAIGLWTLPQEEYRGRVYHYLVQGEAFDWLLLAERLCCELDGLVPREEQEQLLFHGGLPEEVGARDFEKLIGLNKYRASLNYWYGVVMEETIHLAVEDEVRKQHRARGFPDSEDLIEEAFVRIYEDSRTNLLKEFLNGMGTPDRESLTLTDVKEFTYWLFKRRMKMWDPARVASDTRKGLEKLHRLQAAAHHPSPQQAAVL